MAEATADFFVSYTGADKAWAEWVAWQLEAAGYQVIVQAWDFEPGDNFVVRMRDALEQADRTLALVSAAYLASPYCTDEWTGAFLHDDDGRNRLLQLRIEDCQLPRLLAAQVHLDPGWARPASRPRRACWPESNAAGVSPLGSRPSPKTNAQDHGFRGTAWRSPTCHRATPTSPAALPCWSSCTRRLPVVGRRRWCRRRPCMGWVGSARPSWHWSTPTGTRSTTTLSGGCQQSSRSPSQDCWPGWPDAWGLTSRPTRWSCWPACGTSCAGGTVGCSSMTTPKGHETSKPAGHRAVAAGCWSRPAPRSGSGPQPRSGWTCCTARRRWHSCAAAPPTPTPRRWRRWPRRWGICRWRWSRPPPTWTRPAAPRPSTCHRHSGGAACRYRPARRGHRTRVLLPESPRRPSSALEVSVNR
jgi:hypothetical protein